MAGESDALAVKDLFAYFIAYFPDFPIEDNMTPAKALEALVSEIDRLRSTATNESRLHWLKLCNADLEKAILSQQKGDEALVASAVKSARDFFDYYLTRKRANVNFIAGGDISTQKPL